MSFITLRHSDSFSSAQTSLSGFDEFLNQLGLVYHQFPYTCFLGKSYSNNCLIGLKSIKPSLIIDCFVSSQVAAFLIFACVMNYLGSNLEDPLPTTSSLTEIAK